MIWEEDDLFGHTNSASAAKSPGLTLEPLEKAKELLDSLKEDMYYALSEFMVKGKVVSIKQDEIFAFPDCFICHPDDFETIKEQLVGYNLIPLSEFDPWQE